MYLVARYDEAVTEMSYRAYITEAVRQLGQMKTLKLSWLETMEPQPDVDVGKLIEGVISRAELETLDGPS